jgi:hypothetical protein
MSQDRIKSLVYLWIYVSYSAHISLEQNPLLFCNMFYFSIKGILSTKIVFFFISNIIVVFRTDLHKMKINTKLCCKGYDLLTEKTQNYRYRNYFLG